MALFPEAMGDLIRQGRQHHPEVTGRFIQAMEEHRGWDLDAQVATLPPACRTQAEQIVSEARYCRLTDEQIAHAICEAERASCHQQSEPDPPDVIDGRSGMCF